LIGGPLARSCGLPQSICPIRVAELIRTPGTLWQNSAQADLLEVADTDRDAATELGVQGDDLTPAVRMTELKNWLSHLDKIG